MPPGQRVKIGPLEIPGPPLAVHAAWVLMLVGAVVWGGFWVRAQVKAVPEAVKVQMDLAAKHFGETPARTFTGYEDERGELKAMEFSDGTAALVRRVGNGPRQMAWLMNPAKSEGFPVATLSPDLTFAAPAEAQNGYCNAPFPHPYQTGQQDRQVDGCIYERVWYFGDGCIAAQYFNACSGVWDIYPNGQPLIRWPRCLH